jgi:hypothetical protein
LHRIPAKQYKNISSISKSVSSIRGIKLPPVYEHFGHLYSANYNSAPFLALPTARTNRQGDYNNRYTYPYQNVIYAETNKLFGAEHYSRYP